MKLKPAPILKKNVLVGELKLMGTRISSPYSWPVLWENGILSIQLKGGRGGQKSGQFGWQPLEQSTSTMNDSMMSMRDILGVEVVCADGPENNLS